MYDRILHIVKPETKDMNRSLYGNKMLVADLITSSIWALFAAKSTPEIEYWALAAILMRIILCFQLFERSRWAGYSAIIFACAYFMLPNQYTFGFRHVPVDMMYYALHIVNWDMANEFFLHPETPVFQVSFYLIWGALTVWLVLMPVIISGRNKSMFSFPKWSWINIILFAVTAIPGLRCYEYYNLFTLWIVVSCYLPEVYWIIVNGRKESLADAISGNRPLVYYCAFAALFLCAITIGFRNLYLLRPVALLCIPAVFYILLGKSSGMRHIPTYDTAGMCVTGMIYWFCLESGETGRIIGFIMAALILIAVGIRLAGFTSSRLMGVTLVAGCAFILFPALWGMNPYTVLNAGHTRLYMKKTGSCHGLYVTNNFDVRCGLRDRYGEILPMKYFSIDILDHDHDQAILCCMETGSDNGGRTASDDIYSFFNLRTRKFIDIPGYMPVKAVERIRKGVYALYSGTESPSSYLVMP